MNRRRRLAGAATTGATFVLGLGLAVAISGSAIAAATSSTSTTTTATQGTPAGPQGPASEFFVVNGTVNAASDHERIGSSAFPNYTNGAVDNYYALAHSHVDNSPFAQGTASPADTGPVGQTAAAGNFQQPQYADARWPGGPDKATYGSKGAPYATASAGEYRATADASAPSNDLSGPGPTGKLTLAVPKGFDAALRQALGLWKATWLGRAAPTAAAPVPKAPPTVSTPAGTVTAPSAPLEAPTVPDLPAPSVTVPTPTVPAVGPPRSLSATPPPDGETLLSSSTLATLVPIAGEGEKAASSTLVTSGESSLGRVSIGGGQIVIEGIHVTASIRNDGTPSYKAAISVASASIGGVPVTIDEDGVHVATQSQALPYQQASDALNNALEQAGVRIFLVAPEVTTCGQSGGPSGGGTTTSTTTTTTTTPTTTSDQSQPPGSCDQGGSSTACSPSGTTTGTTATTTSTSPLSPTTTTAPCDQSGSTGCEQTGTTTGATTTAPTTSTSTTPSWCGTSDTMTTTPTTGTCPPAGTTGTTTTTPGARPGATTTTTTPGTTTTTQFGPLDPMNPGGGAGSTEQTVTATGVHVVFTQPVNQSGVPAQFVEHILGEVYVDSLAVPAPPLASVDLSSSLPAATLAGVPGSASSSCVAGAAKSTKTAAGAPAAGGSSTGGSASSQVAASAASPIAPAGSVGAVGATAQPGAGSPIASLPATFAAALRKPAWLLAAYLVWQALVIGTGISLWHWRREDVT